MRRQLSVYGDLAPVYTLIFGLRTGTTAEQLPRRGFGSPCAGSEWWSRHRYEIRVLAVEDGAASCGWRRVAVADEISAWNWRGNVGWREERAGHELSSPIGGMGHSRGWQPGWKV